MVLTLDHDAIALAESLARRWMPGTRGGTPNRLAWEHPRAVAQLVQVHAALFPTLNVQHMVELAWLHDIIEDGRRENGQPVTAFHLLDAGVGHLVVEDVVALTCKPDEAKPVYLERLQTASLEAKLVKCCDRLANLREGAATRGQRWLERYAAQTREHVLPLADGLPDPARSWVVEQLDSAMVARGER